MMMLMTGWHREDERNKKAPESRGGRDAEDGDRERERQSRGNRELPLFDNHSSAPFNHCGQVRANTSAPEGFQNKTLDVL